MAKSHVVPSSEEAAHLVMGDDIIFPEDVVTAHGFPYTEWQLKHLADTIPSVEQLRWCKDNGYAVVAGPRDYVSVGPSTDKAGCEWLAIRKEIAPESTDKMWDEQQKLLGKHEQVPNAAETRWFIKTYYDVRKVRLFPNVCVRTSSVISGGRRIAIGKFNTGDNPSVGTDGGDVRHPELGITTSRRFNN